MFVKAKIEKGVIVESYLLDETPEHLESWTTLPIEAGPGWRYDGVNLLPPTEEFMWDRVYPIREKMKITFAQLLIGFAEQGWITQSEAINWMNGALPGLVASAIANLATEQQFAATIKATKPTDISRVEPWLLSVAKLQNKTVEQMDEFFNKYATI